jgi:anaerobic dimethyl sulfoxide reductase subunit B (iron-sulfur subunit)
LLRVARWFKSRRYSGADKMQIGFYFDQTRCIGCLACVVACKQWNRIPPGLVKWRKVITTERGKYPDVSVSFLSSGCYHCENPACLKVCPSQAIRKRETNGVVVVDKKLCLGGMKCRFACQKACPYDAPQFGFEENPRMQKCNFCEERQIENKKPICVEACITGALDADSMEQLKSKYDPINEAKGFVYSQRLKPAICFKANRHNK